jgi:hypothetical protein
LGIFWDIREWRCLMPCVYWRPLPDSNRCCRRERAMGVAVEGQRQAELRNHAVIQVHAVRGVRWRSLCRPYLDRGEVIGLSAGARFWGCQRRPACHRPHRTGQLQVRAPCPGARLSRGGLRCSDRENRDDVVSYAYPHDTGVARSEPSVERLHQRELRCGRLVPQAF